VNKVLFFCISCICSVLANSQDLLSGMAQVSLLTCSPSDHAVYALYGHSALRVRDTTGLDYVFNYGVFDQSRPNFIYHFTRGETDYMLAASRYDEFLIDYQMRGREVFEQTLNLSQSEKNALFRALVINARPENRVYRYSFFYDNCSTRPVEMVERIIEGHIEYAPYTPGRTYRDVINVCTRDVPWLTFGCDIVLGMPADKVMTLKESFFLPANVKEAFAGAQIVRSDNTSQPLVSATAVLVENIPDDEPVHGNPFSPLACCCLVLALAAGITLFEMRTRKYVLWFDILLFTIAGLAGCVVWFLCFASVHRGMWPNISVVWLHPFHLVGALLFTVKKLNKAAYCYHFINFAALLLMSAGWFFIPQHLNIAFIPLIASLLLRSGYGLRRIKRNIR